MPILSIAPTRIPGGNSNGFAFDSNEMNQIVRAEYQDTFGMYQRLFNVFGYMFMNSKREFVLHQPKGTPLMWQKYSSCSYDPTGSLSIGRRTFQPDLIYMSEKFCHDEFLESAYEHWVEATAGGDITLSQPGVAAFNLMLDELMANATYGFRLSLVAGQLYDVETVTYNAENAASITDLFKRTHGSVRGIIKLIYDLAQSDYTHMNHPLFDDSDFNAQGDYTGNIVTLFDELRAGAPKPLRQLYNHGGAISNAARRFVPMYVVSDSFFNAVIDYYNAESEKTATNRMRIVQREVAGADTGVPQFVYYLDGRIPIIPLSDASGYDEYLAGRTHFAALVASGNMQLGHQFGNIPQVERDNLGMLISQVTDDTRDDYGMYSVKSHAAVKSAIADPNYISASISYTE